jgi:uncharacterized protein DUF4255
MSDALAIAGTTAVLQYYLHNLYGTVAANFPTPVHVSSLAPDQVQQQLQAGGANAENRVNIFLHLVTPNPGWRNVGYASMSSDGTTQTGNPPLALDLHYLLTVYGSDPWQSEALLGFALMMLHQAPVLTREDISAALAARAGSSYPYPGYPLNNTLGQCGLADQVEMLKITPEALGREELAWLWTALKADYRLTFPFQVSVALMQPDRPASFALPVLKTVFSAVPTAPPIILDIQTASGQPVAQQGEQVVLTGEFLTGASTAVMTHSRLGIQLKLINTTPTQSVVTFQLPPIPPNPGTAYPAGIYDLEVLWTDPVTGTVLQSSNTVSFAIAPWLPATQLAASAPSGSQTLITLSHFAPGIWPGQQVSLGLSTVSAVAPFISVTADAQSVLGDTPLSSASFLFPTGLPTGQNLLARLEVDGAGSVIQANIPKTGMPSFTGPWVTL